MGHRLTQPVFDPATPEVDELRVARYRALLALGKYRRSRAEVAAAILKREVIVHARRPGSLRPFKG